MWELHVEIYERSVGTAYPVVEHVFRGKTKAEAQGYYESHLDTDEFLRDCVRKKRWRNISCEASGYWKRKR